MAFASVPLRHPQTFLTPKALNLLVIDDPPLATSVMVGRPEATPRMVLSVLAKPPSQSGIRMLGSIGGGFVALGGAVLPGHAAGEPFADPQHPLEVTNGRPPAFRA